MQSQTRSLTQCGTETLPFLMDHLPDFYQKKAEVELNESHENKIKGLQAMREMIKGHWDPRDISIEDVESIGLMIFQQTIRDPMSQINGYKVIHDCKGTHMRSIPHATPYKVYRTYQAYWHCLPARYKELHVVNPSIPFKFVWSCLKHFVPQKFRKRIIVHSSPEGLSNYFPRSVLPVQYGGDLKDYYQADWIRNAVKQHKSYGIGGQSNYY